MSPGLADRLNAERHRRFVGRVAERDLFRSALASDEPPFNVLYVFGPGGVGKTTLLREFVNTCNELGIPAGYVDARHLNPSRRARLSGVHVVRTAPGAVSVMSDRPRSPTSPLIVVPELLSGWTTNPLYYLWLGLTLLRVEKFMAPGGGTDSLA